MHLPNKRHLSTKQKTPVRQIKDTCLPNKRHLSAKQKTPVRQTKDTCSPSNRRLPAKHTTIHGMEISLFRVWITLIAVVDGMFYTDKHVETEVDYSTYNDTSHNEELIFSTSRNSECICAQTLCCNMFSRNGYVPRTSLI